MTYAIIVPDDLKTDANMAAHLAGVDPEGLLDTFSVPLVPADGPAEAEPTHWACCGHISEASRAGLYEIRDQFPSAMWWRWDGNRRLTASHNGADVGKFWDWDNCLCRAGLQRRNEVHLVP